MHQQPPSDPHAQRLTASLLLWAYQQGWFPMANPLIGELEWFSPDPRGIIPLDTFHVSGSLARECRRSRFEIRGDTAFEAVMRACASPRKSDSLSWIDDRMVEAYVGLHRLGHAHSLEAWREGQLIGGLYGVQVRGAFFGESMFSRPELGGTNASKVCLVHLVAWLRRRNFLLLDTQFWTVHLDQFGCVEVDRSRYLAMLRAALDQDASWGRFEPAVDDSNTRKGT